MTRSATIKTEDFTEFLVIEGDDFQRILKNEHEQTFLNKLQFLKSAVNLFRNWKVKDVQKLVELSQVQTFPRNSVIIREDEGSEHIYFVKIGTCKVVKTVQFIKRCTCKNKHILLPFKSEEETPLDPKTDILCTKLVELFFLPSGSYFGEGDLLMKSRRQALSEVFDKQPSPLGFTIMTTRRVECLVMSKMDFVRVASDRDFDDMGTKYQEYPSLDVILDSFYVNRNWFKWRQKELQEIMHDKRLRRERQRFK